MLDCMREIKYIYEYEYVCCPPTIPHPALHPPSFPTCLFGWEAGECERLRKDERLMFGERCWMLTNRTVITPGSRLLSQQTRQENRLSGSNKPQSLHLNLQ